MTTVGTSAPREQPGWRNPVVELTAQDRLTGRVRGVAMAVGPLAEILTDSRPRVA